MARRVLSDASPLIALASVEGLDWLQALFGEVWIPPEVRAEVVGSRGFAGEQAIADAMADGWLRVAESVPSTPELPDLDEGESACIRLALVWNEPALLLMDERAGRAVAEEMGLRVAGTAAVIGMAKLRDLIPSARDVFAQLHRTDFRISPEVITTVLERVGEQSTSA